MSKFVFNSKTVALFFAFVFAIALWTPFIQAGGTTAGSKVSKSAKKGKRMSRSATDLIAEVMDIASAFGGQAVEDAIEEFTSSLQQTSALLESLAEEDTIDSINFLIRNALSSLGEAAHKLSADNAPGDTVESSDFIEFLDLARKTLVDRCRNKSNFSGNIFPQLDIFLPAVLQGLGEIYKNLYDTMGFGLKFSMLSQGMSLLSLLERSEYVTKETFTQFVRFPQEIKGQIETAVEDLIMTYVDPTQLEMVLNMAKMYANSYANRRAEHEDL
jgi:hypothetical protein